LPAAETLPLHGGTGAGQPAEDALPPVTSLGSDVAKAVLDLAVRPRGQTLRAALVERRRQRVALRAAERHRQRSAPVAVAAALAAQRAFLGARCAVVDAPIAALVAWMRTLLGIRNARLRHTPLPGGRSCPNPLTRKTGAERSDG
jgi:hypothetical protein